MHPDSSESKQIFSKIFVAPSISDATCSFSGSSDSAVSKSLSSSPFCGQGGGDGCGEREGIGRNNNYLISRYKLTLDGHEN